MISVVIPAFNEEGSIADVITQTETILDSTKLSYEVIVVDDGSMDNTRNFVLNNGARLITYTKNRGKGYALRRGFAEAEGEILITMDADGSHEPKDILKIIHPLLNGFDVVFGSRFLNNGGGRVTSRLHAIGNHLFNFLILALTGKKISDSQTGFRGYRREVIREMKLRSDGYEVESELTVKALKNGFKTREAPITCLRRSAGHSKLRSFSDGFRIFKAILEANFI